MGGGAPRDRWWGQRVSPAGRPRTAWIVGGGVAIAVVSVTLVAGHVFHVGIPSRATLTPTPLVRQTTITIHPGTLESYGAVAFTVAGKGWLTLVGARLLPARPGGELPVVVGAVVVVGGPRHQAVTTAGFPPLGGVVNRPYEDVQSASGLALQGGRPGQPDTRYLLVLGLYAPHPGRFRASGVILDVWQGAQRTRVTVRTMLTVVAQP